MNTQEKNPSRELPISQYTGALSIMFLFHTIELIHCTRHPRPVQIMYKQVPVFRTTGQLSFSERTPSGFTITFKVPVEGDDAQHKTYESEGTVKLVWREMHSDSRRTSEEF